MSRLLFCVLIILSGIFSELKADAKVDSLLNALKETPKSEHSKIFRDLCWELTFRHSDSAMLFGNRAVSIAMSLNDSAELALAYNELSTLHLYQGRTTKAIPLLSKALEIELDLMRQDRIAALCQKLGLAYNDIGNFETSLDYSLRALSIYERYKSLNEMAAVMSSIGKIYNGFGNFEKAKEFQKRARSTYEILGDSIGVSTVLIQDAKNYFGLKVYDEMYLASEGAIFILRGVKGYEFELSQAYFFLGRAQLLLGYPFFAETTLLNALSLNEIVDDKKFETQLLNELALVYINQNCFDTSLVILGKAEQIARENKFSGQLVAIYQSFAKYYSSLDTITGLSYDYSKKAFDLRDSLTREEERSRVANMQAIYESQQKEASIAQLNELQSNINFQIFQQKYLLAFIVGIGFLIAILMFFLMHYRRLKSELSQNQIEISFSKQIIKNTILTQEQEKIKLSKELLDGISPSIGVVKMNLDYNVISDKNSGVISIEEKNKAVALLTEAQKEIISISHKLIPPTLSKDGLVIAIEDLLQSRLGSQNISFKFRHDLANNERFPQPIEIGLYRIIEELISNMSKSSGASVMVLKLSKMGNEIYMVIEDDGHGIASKPENNSKSLANIMSRVEALDGYISWNESSLGGLRTEASFVFKTNPIKDDTPKINQKPKKKFWKKKGS